MKIFFDAASALVGVSDACCCYPTIRAVGLAIGRYPVNQDMRGDSRKFILDAIRGLMVAGVTDFMVGVNVLINCLVQCDDAPEAHQMLIRFSMVLWYYAVDWPMVLFSSHVRSPQQAMKHWHFSVTCRAENIKHRKIVGKGGEYEE